MKTKQKSVGLKELRENTEKYINAVNRGMSFMVFRRSKPIFRITPADEEDLWETVVDFTEVDKKGVSANTVLSRLKAYGAKD